MYKKWRWISFFISLAAAFLALIGFALNGTAVSFVLLPIALILLVIASVLDFFKCCCPSCQRHIRERSFPLDAYENCPYCGADLDSWKDP